jgi:hypothetical protein
VTILVNLYNLPAQEVRLLVNGEHEFRLHGTQVQLNLQKVGPGYHLIQVYVEGYREEPVEKSFTVIQCPRVQRGELYKQNGTGLKGYCPEPEPCPPCDPN